MCASRRHIGGCGDVVAWKPGYPPKLIEVKRTKTPWSNFGPADRQALVDYAHKHAMEPVLAWVHGSRERMRIRYLPPAAWPN